MGGAVRAINAGFQKQEIEESAYSHLKAVESGERTIVGVNAYQTQEPPVQRILQMDTEQAKQQMERLKRVRAERDTLQVDTAIQHLREAAGTAGANTMPPILACVEAYATLGEICQALRDAFGTH
jgi:methylmalonyl-CoA mutase N-terminal domain/subunit